MGYRDTQIGWEKPHVETECRTAGVQMELAHCGILGVSTKVMASCFIVFTVLKRRISFIVPMSADILEIQKKPTLLT